MERRHDYLCLTCDTIVRNVLVPSGVSASDGAPRCPHCEFPARMEWMPSTTAMSIFSDGAHHAKFTTTVEDPASLSGHRVVEVDSLATIRRLERESEQAQRNGEGRQMIWRDYSQTRSNTDVHTMGPDPSMKPSKTLSNGQPVRKRVGEAVIADHGTGVED